jgi:acetyl esterase/lipase
MRQSRWVFAAILASSLCVSQASAQEKRAASAVPAGVVYHPDLTYRTVGKTELMLDLAHPRQGASPFPAVVLLHGGGFTKGRKGYMPLVLELAQKGYVAAAVSYHHEPRHAFPAAVHDVQAAVRWLRTHAAKYKIDKDRIGAVGFSAGGGLACLLGMTAPADGLDEQGKHAESARVQAVVAYAPPTDLARWHQHCGWGGKVNPLAGAFIRSGLEAWLGGSPAQAGKTYRQASPLSYARKGVAPILLLHGSADPIVPAEQSQILHEALVKVKGHALLVTVQGAGHDFAERSEGSARLAASAAVAFLDEHLQQAKASK